MTTGKTRPSRAVAAIAALLLAGCTTVADSQPDLARYQTPQPEFGLTRGPDGWYLSRMDAPFGTDAKSKIWRYPFDGGPPVLADITFEDTNERDFSWDAASQTGCFVRESDIWCAGWSAAEGWTMAERLPSPVNTGGYEASPHVAPDGSLYFASQREGGMGQGDIYRARRTAAGWEVEPLGPAINSPTGEWNLALSPDGATMVFEASGRQTNRTVPGDLYLSCLVDGEWQPAEPMHALNTDGSDLDFRFTGPREGVFTTAKIGGDGMLRYAGPEHFARCG